MAASPRATDWQSEPGKSSVCHPNSEILAQQTRQKFSGIQQLWAVYLVELGGRLDLKIQGETPTSPHLQSSLFSLNCHTPQPRKRRPGAPQVPSPPFTAQPAYGKDGSKGARLHCSGDPAGVLDSGSRRFPFVGTLSGVSSGDAVRRTPARRTPRNV